jgi:ribosomal protein S27E
MTYREAKQRLDDWYAGEIVDISPEVLVCCYDAIKKQIPKTPQDFDSVPRNRCPNCHDAVRVYSHGMKLNHCPWCGQALDWNRIE